MKMSGQVGHCSFQRRGWLVEAVRTHVQQEIRRMLVVCALEFASSRIVWCASRGDRWVDQQVDLTSPDEARRLVKELLAEF